jgi:hypothetical protein
MPFDRTRSSAASKSGSAGGLKPVAWATVRRLPIAIELALDDASMVEKEEGRVVPSPL